VTGREGAIGGLVGGISGNIINSYSAGTVTGEKKIGGLAGTCSGKITNSYSAGKVVGDSLVGGFVGVMDFENMTISSYYDKDMSGQSNGAGTYESRISRAYGNNVYSKTTIEMKEKSTYEGWDFDTVWGISGEVNGGYPYLLNYNKSLP
jgi:hypothetical protein